LSLDTDVNAALLGEMRQGAAQGLRDAIYLTIGTGIGAGVCAEGNLVHGTLHPEIGHLRVPRHPDDNFAGVCPFHGDCWEGLASGPAIDKRWDRPAHLVEPEHPAWEMQAWYLAQGILAACAILSPAMIILGGGVSQARGLHEKVARHLDALSAGYFENLGSRLTAPQLGQQAGIIGAMLLNEI
jgi:fructokinase